MSVMPAADMSIAGHNGDINHDRSKMLQPVFLPSSITDSQSSSFDDSIPSQASQQHAVSKNTSQSSTDRLSIQEANPPSSHSLSTNRNTYPESHAASQQDTPSIPQGSVQSEQGSMTLDVRGALLGSLNPDMAHGQKRTASGHIKSASSSLHTSPVDTLQMGHSRQTSRTSNSSNIGELSSQLKTRLSYAMMKVQNGWQNRTIDEIESMTSQQNSPVSAAVSPRRPFESPRANMMNIYRERSVFAESSERTTAPLDQSLSAPHTHLGISGQDHAYVQRKPLSYSPSAYSIDSTQGRPHQQSLSGSNTPRHLPIPPASGPSLAPPVDFISRNPRRSNPSQLTAPSRHIDSVQSLSNLSTSSASTTQSTSHSTAHSVIPATPPSSRRPPAIKTSATQATSMEKDAIETLIFMSSPGNSQYHPTNSQLPGTPLRNHFLAAEKRVGFATTAIVDTRKRGLFETGSLAHEEDIDKLLDGMPEGDSSSEDEMLMSPRERSGAAYA